MSKGNLILSVNSVTNSYLIYYDSLLQNATELYYKMRQVFLLQNATTLLQNATVITNCDDFITKWDSYYKIRLLLQTATVHAPLITKESGMALQVSPCSTIKNP